MDKTEFAGLLVKPIDTAKMDIPPSEDWSDPQLYNKWWLGEDPETHPDPGIMYMARVDPLLAFIIQIAGLETTGNPPTQNQLGFFSYIGEPDMGEYIVVQEIPDDVANKAIKALYPSTIPMIAVAALAGAVLIGVLISK